MLSNYLKIYNSLLLIFVFTNMGFAQLTLPPKNLSYEKLEMDGLGKMEIPNFMVGLSQETIAGKYITPDPPEIVYEHPLNKEIYFSANKLNQRWKEPDLEMFGKMQEANLNVIFDKSLRIYDSGIIEVNGKVCYYISASTNAVANNKAAVKLFIQRQIFIVEEQVYLMTFTSPFQSRKEWEPIGKHILASIKLKKSYR